MNSNWKLSIKQIYYIFTRFSNDVVNSFNIYSKVTGGINATTTIAINNSAKTLVLLLMLLLPLLLLLLQLLPLLLLPLLPQLLLTKKTATATTTPTTVNGAGQGRFRWPCLGFASWRWWGCVVERGWRAAGFRV